VKVTQAYRFALDPAPSQDARTAVAPGGGAVRVELGPGPVQGTGTKPRASGTALSTCTSCGMRRRRPIRAWPGGSRTPSAPTRRRSATLTGRFATLSSPGRASAKAASSGSLSSRSAAGAGTRSGSPPGRCAAPVTTVTPAPARHNPHPRVDAQGGPPPGGGIGPNLVGHRLRTAQRWFVSFTIEVERDAPEPHARPGSVIGIDLGVTTLLTGVDDTGIIITVPGPRPLRAALRKLRRASRAHSRKTPGSANRRKHAPGSPASTLASPMCAPMPCTKPRPLSPPATRPSSPRI